MRYVKNSLKNSSIVHLKKKMEVFNSPFPSYQERIFKYAPSTFIMAFMFKSNSLLLAYVKLNTDSY